MVHREERTDPEEDNYRENILMEGHHGWIMGTGEGAIALASNHHLKIEYNVRN